MPVFFFFHLGHRINMRLTKIYTKLGDKGLTQLAFGQKVSKADARIEGYGSVDELNAHIGVLRDSLIERYRSIFEPEIAALQRIQNELFDLGGELATMAESLDLGRQKVVGKADIERLEREMDAFNEALEPLANFVLPGGNICNSFSHVARTVCRRAERRVVGLSKSETLREEVLIYLNRLSDWLFLLGRTISKKTSSAEVLWQQKR